MDTLEWGNDYDDLEFTDVPDSSFDSAMIYQDPFSSLSYRYENNFYDDVRNDSRSYFNTMQQQQPRIDFLPQIKQEVESKPQLSTQIQRNFYNTPIPQQQKVVDTKTEMNTELDVKIEGQPPVEVRTRTPSEIRTFSVCAKVVGKIREYDACIMKVALCYAANGTNPAENVKKDILGGTKTVALLPDGTAVFDNLWVSESSTKHKEREFCIEFILLRSNGHEIIRKYSKPFYAYSHKKKVLQRRGNVKVRTLSKSWGRMSGGDQMHVIGTPFIQGPALKLIFRTPHGDVVAKSLEFYSDSVLFFELPPYPLPDGVIVAPDTEIRTQVLLTNDGRTFSNPIDFSYLADNTPRSRI